MLWINDWGVMWRWHPPTIYCTGTTGESLLRINDTPNRMRMRKRFGKKTSRPYCRNQESLDGRRADPADVYGRGTLRPYFRYTALLVSEAHSPCLLRNGEPGIHLRLRGC